MSTADWVLEVAKLRDEASDALDAEAFEDATARIGRAFAIVDANHGEAHIVHASLICVAADMSLIVGELEAATRLYDRALQIVEAQTADSPLAAKALNGLAIVDKAEGRFGSAEQRFRRALSILESSSHPDAELGRAAIRSALMELKT